MAVVLGNRVIGGELESLRRDRSIEVVQIFQAWVKVMAHAVPMLLHRSPGLTQYDEGFCQYHRGKHMEASVCDLSCLV